MLSKGITEVLKEASKGKELEDILKEMALNEILKNTRLSARGKEVTYDMNPNLSIYNNPMETGIKFEKRFADGGIASAIGEIQKRKDGGSSNKEDFMKKGINSMLESLGIETDYKKLIKSKRDKAEQKIKADIEATNFVKNLMSEYMDGTKTFGQFQKDYGNVEDLKFKYIEKKYPDVYKNFYSLPLEMRSKFNSSTEKFNQATGEIQNRKDGSDAMGEGGIGNLLVGEDGLLFDTSSPGTMAADAGILALTVFPPAAIAARLIQAGYKGAKLTKAMNQVKKIQESVPKTGLGLKGSGRGSTFMQLTVPKEVAGVANMADGGVPKTKLQAALSIFDRVKKMLKQDKKKNTKKDGVTDRPPTTESAIPGELKAIAGAIKPVAGNKAVQKNLIRTAIYGAPALVATEALLEPDAVETAIEDKIVPQMDEEKVLDDSVEKEVKGRFDFLKDMDPALARALIAGGSAMLRPTEGPVRSFLSLGEFGGAFADSLSKSDAAKTDLERLYATVVAQTPEGEEPPTVQEFLLSQKGGSDNLTLENLQQGSAPFLGLLNERFGGDYEFDDFQLDLGNGNKIPLIEAYLTMESDEDLRALLNKAELKTGAEGNSGGFLPNIRNLLSGD